MEHLDEDLDIILRALSGEDTELKALEDAKKAIGEYLGHLESLSGPPHGTTYHEWIDARLTRLEETIRAREDKDPEEDKDG